MSSDDDEEYSSMDEEVRRPQRASAFDLISRLHRTVLSSQEAAVALAEAEAAPAAEGERQSIYNTDAMHDKLEDISWSTEQPWVETQVVTHAQPTVVNNVDDDLARELAFYNQVQRYLVVMANSMPAAQNWQQASLYCEAVVSTAHAEWLIKVAH